MTKENMKEILDICSQQACVRDDVIKNYNNNLWWPLEISDYRIRLIVAGLSTRINYNMIESYRNVIFQLNRYTYPQLRNMPQDDLCNIIKKLGLVNNRYRYIKSMMAFIENHDNLLEMETDALIKLIADEVVGASYKVAQCCVLYMRGYNCGIMPVDSGMKDMLLPCIGFSNYGNGIGHEKIRSELEACIKQNDLAEILYKNGYSQLHIEDSSNAAWWAHLVLIYYKRHYCNKHKPNMCPLNSLITLNSCC